MLSPRPPCDFRVLRVLPSPPLCWHICTLSKSPSLPLSSSPGSGRTCLYTLYTFYTGKVIRIGLLAWSASGGLLFVDSVENPCAVDILARSSRSPQSSGDGRIHDASALRHRHSHSEEAACRVRRRSPLSVRERFAPLDGVRPLRLFLGTKPRLPRNLRFAVRN